MTPTNRDPVVIEPLVDNALTALRVEMGSAYKKFGSLTQDRFKAYTIMGEENGEVARAILELQHAERLANGLPVVKAKTEELKSELLQVASVALFFYINLTDEEK